MYDYKRIITIYQKILNFDEKVILFLFIIFDNLSNSMIPFLCDIILYICVIRMYKIDNLEVLK